MLLGDFILSIPNPLFPISFLFYVLYTFAAIKMRFYNAVYG